MLASSLRRYRVSGLPHMSPQVRVHRLKSLARDAAECELVGGVLERITIYDMSAATAAAWQLAMTRMPVKSGGQVLVLTSKTKPTVAGIDLYNKYVDRSSDDNLVEFS